MAALTDYQKLCGFKQQKNYFFTVPKTEEQNQVVSRPILSLEALEVNPFLGPSSFWWRSAFTGL